MTPERSEDDSLEVSLRPKRLVDFVGQQQARENLSVFIDAAKARGEYVGENPARWKGHLESLLPQRSKIRGNQVVGSSTPALINLGCGRINQFAVRIEGAEQPDLIGPRIGFNSPQRFGIDEKRCLHGAIVSPKPHGAPRCIIKAALIRKTKRHGFKSRCCDAWSS